MSHAFAHAAVRREVRSLRHAGWRGLVGYFRASCKVLTLPCRDYVFVAPWTVIESAVAVFVH